ncbi:MAG TPA: hypothetical protein VK652_01415 [Steroidobacteraceae bacterium]|nr:hypothetical protein [Steroidobacteraceae bacterium]
MKNFLTRGKLLLVIAFASAVGGVVQAAPAGDYDAITAAVDWSDVISGIAAIAALVAAVLVVKKGAKMLLGMIGR